MSPSGVILYGPPGSGKDTITAELSALRPEFVLFQRLKAGPGRTAGYRLTTAEHVEELAQAGEILYRNSRYDAEYAIDRGEVSALVDAGRIPVLHVGQVTGAHAVAAHPINWARVLLWCPEDVTRQRCQGRGDKDLDTRLKVWHETRQDLLDHAAEPWSLVIRTDQLSAAQAAQAIDKARLAGAPPEVRDIPGLVG
ncbi:MULTISPECIES: guanylate kinase [unclassified Streptomyces]|uniref:guanylate kinase n=1 Tax=unclassified Streptomyces TaxID=2593676 RepID=UPI00236502A8|nr:MULTISPECIES: guanylate kinase [unclassified Streptomyces]MDF3140091.1 guanylate kinase [Streptomyces sp. T21Q-yed]WDF40145.1 guanylate kinase [Streptomyces sp. T12]